MDKRINMTELTNITENRSQNTNSPTLDDRLERVRINTPKQKFENEPFNGEVYAPGKT